MKRLDGVSGVAHGGVGDGEAEERRGISGRETYGELDLMNSSGTFAAGEKDAAEGGVGGGDGGSEVDGVLKIASRRGEIASSIRGGSGLEGRRCLLEDGRVCRTAALLRNRRRGSCRQQDGRKYGGGNDTHAKGDFSGFSAVVAAVGTLCRQHSSCIDMAVCAA